MRKKDADKRDPICGMQGTIKKHGHWFCSQACIEKYERLRGHRSECPTCEAEKPKEPWFKQKLFLVTAVVAAVFVADALLASQGNPLLSPLTKAFVEYTELIWFPILIGFLLGGVIDYLVPREYISKYLARPQKRTVFYAVGLGFLMSACSHGILAIAMQLYKKGDISYEAALFYSTSPNEFALKVSGVDGTSDRTFAEEVMEDSGGRGGGDLGIEGMTP